MESKASRSARVKLQLRDKKGRWIEMGSHIKWLNIAGEPIHGVAVGQKGQNVIAEVDSIENPGEKTNVEIHRKKVEVIDAKADLDGPAPDGDKEIPGEVEAEAPVAPKKYNSTPGPSQIVVKTTDGTSISSLIGTLKVGDKVYPVGSGMKPYSNPTSGSSAAFKKYSSGGVATITAIKEGKYATIEDAEGNKSFSSLKHYAVKQTPELDAAIFAAHKEELAALKDGGVGTPSESKWIAALDPSAPKEPTEDDEQKAALPPTEPPVDGAPATPDEPFDASKSKVGDKVTLPDGEATKTADNTWKIPGKGNALSDGQVNTYYNSANGDFKPLLDAPAAVEPDVKVTSNHKASPGTVRVSSADDKTPIVVSVASLKVGDKVYPVSSLHNKPYGDHGNYNHKSVFVHTENPAGIGTVVSKGSNYATVKGEDGKLYYPTNNFVALKSTPGIDAKIEEVKATFDAPEEAPEAPAAPEAPEVQAPEAEAPAAPAPEAPAAPAEQSPVKKPIDISKWKKTGAQMGSNDGGVYTDEDGKQWYVKKPASNEHAMNEVLADDLYKAAGIETSELQLADLGNGKLGTASPMLDGVQKNLSTKLASDKNYKKELQDGFAMDVLLANWDVVGLEFDNVVTTKEGKPVRVDPGGALLFRAMGSPKGDAFDKMASEWDTLRDSSTNSKSAKAFKDMTDEQLVESAKRVEYLTPGLIDAHVDASGFDEATKTKLKDTLKARRENIIQRAKAITPVEEQDDEPIGEAPAAPAAPEPTPEVAPEPVAPEPEPEAPEAPVAPAPEPQPEAPAAPSPQEEPAPAPTETPAAEEDPFAGLVLKDKGKTVPDANGDLLKVGTKVTHSNGKNGKGIVTIIYPSTNSAKVYYENGVEQVANGKLLTPTAADVTAEPLVPAKLSVGEVFFDTATGKTHIGAKDGTPLTAGSKVSYTKKGVTQTGTVKGIYKGQQTVNVDFEDGTNSTKKASALVSAEESVVDVPETPEQDAPDVTPTPEDVTPEPEAPEAPEESPETPEAPEPAPEVAPAEPESLDGKVDPTAEDLDSLPVGAKITSDASNATYIKNEDGKWEPVTGDHGPYHTNMMVDGDKVAHGYKVDLAPTPTPDATPEEAPAAEPDAEPIGVSTIGKVFNDLTEDQISALPVGTMLKNSQHGHHWKKEAGGGWKAYDTDGKTVIGGENSPIYISTGTLSEAPHNKLNTIVEVPGNDEAPTVDAPETEAPEVEAPEAPATDLKSFEGKKFSDLTDEQMDSVPVGTKLVSTGHGHFWQKISAEEWEAHKKEDWSKLNTKIGNWKLKTDPWKSTHTLELPKDETPVADAPEVAPVEAPVPEATPEPVDVSSLEGEKLAMLDPNELKALPVGTTLNDPSTSSVFIKKTGDNAWTQYMDGFDGNVIATYNDESILPATKSPSGKHDATVVLPKPGEDEAAPAAPEVETLDFPENVTTLPVGTVVPARTGSTVGFTKSDDNKWEMTVQGKGIGQYVNDQFVQGVVDTTKPEIIKPNTPDALDEAAPDAPAVPNDGSVEGPNKDLDQWWEDGLKPTASELPIGSVLYTPASGWKATKTTDNNWESSSGSTFIDDDIDGVKNDKSYKIYIPNPPEEVAPEADSAELTGVWGDSDLQSGDMPVGTIIGSDTEGAGVDMIMKKIDEDKWLVVSGSGSAQKKTYPDSTINGLKSYEGWKVNKDEHKAIANPTFDIPDPSPVVTDEAAPATPKSGKWSDGPSAGDAKIGTKITKNNTNYTITKTGDNNWESSSGSTFNDEDLDYFKKNSTYSYEEELAVGEKTELNESIIAGFGDLPIGSKVYTGSAGWNATKTGPGNWVSEYGTDYTDQELINSHNDGYPHFVAVPEGSSLPEAPAADTPNFAEFVGKNLEDTPLTGENSPIGTVLEFPGSMTGTLTKVGDNSWKSADGSPYWDSTVDGVKTGGANWKVKSIPGAETAPGYKDGDQWNNDGPFADVTAADLPVGATITSGNATITKTGTNKWAYKFATSESTTTYTDSDIDGTKSFKTWVYSGPDGAAPAAPESASSGPVTLSKELLNGYPLGTKIVDEKGYTLKKGEKSGVTGAWIPISANGVETKFKDGDWWASAQQLLPTESYFPNASWNVYPPGVDVPSAPAAAPSAAFVAHKGMYDPDIKALDDGSLMVVSEGANKGYIFQVEHDGEGGTKLIPLDPETGNKKYFLDGDYYAAPYEVAANGTYAGFNGDFDVYPPGTPVSSVGNATAPAASSTNAAGGVVHTEMSSDDIYALENGTILVANTGQQAGYVLKKIASNKLTPLDKTTGAPISFTDGDSFAMPSEIAAESEIAAWEDGNGDFTVYPPGTTVADINGTSAPAAPAGPEVPTGAVGSVSNPAVVAGKTLNKAILDSYPAGTVIKKENNSVYPTEYFFIKKSNGNWDMKKKGKDYQSDKTSDWMISTYFSNSTTTATVSQPKPYSKSAVIGTGEIVYPGDTVTYKGDVGYVKSITNAGAINVQVNGKSGPKAASTLSKNPTHGLKAHVAANIGGGTTTTQPVAPPSAPSSPATITTANFAGANADEYNAAGVTVKGNLNTPKSGLGLASTGPVDTTNPLYGVPKPLKPEEPATLKWDSAAWLKKVEERYANNPHKAKNTVQESNNWNTIQSVLEGHAGSLDKLLTNKYVDQDMYDEAKNAIAAHDANVKPIQDAYQADVQAWNTKVEEWEAANPTASQFVDASMPEVSKDPFMGGVADWSKAPVGTYTADAAIAAIKKDAQTASHGISVATDSDQIEDLNVKFNRVLDLNKQEVLEVKFKVTPLFGKDLAAAMQSKGAVKTGQIFLPKYVKDTNTGLFKDTATSYSNSMVYASGSRFEWNDPETGAKVIFNRSSDADTNTPNTLSNSLRILLPKDATSATYQKVLENLNIKAKPATAGDIRVFAENKFITVMGGGANHEYKKNYSGEDRQKQLDKIKAKFGVSPDDLTFGVDSNGDSKFFFTDEAVEKLQKYTKVTGFHHNISGNNADILFAMITGANPGMLSTYQRWGHGVHSGGMSSSTDIGKGSGDFLFTKTDHDESGKASGSGTIGFNAKAMLRRLDVYGNSGDNFGAKSTSQQSPFDLMKGHPYEIMFKHSIPLTEWSHVTLSGGERDKLIKRLKEHGITKINGIPLENFVLTTGMQIPTIDSSVYNVVSG